MAALEFVKLTRQTLRSDRQALAFLAWYPAARMASALEYCLPPFAFLRLAMASLQVIR